MAEKKLSMGIDIGSVSVNTVLLENGRVIFEDYSRIKELPAATLLRSLKKLLALYRPGDISTAGTTGSGGKLAASLLNAVFINEIVAHSRSAGHFHPDTRTIIDIGGQDAKMIMVRYDGDRKKMEVEGFSMNTICAAGTGSFLDQQASRMGVSIEKEFGELAMKSVKPPRIAGRCSVFAKTDMIHLQQQGTPDYDIVAGLCFALARTFRSNICRGKELKPAVSFHGGVAYNSGMERAFREILSMPGDEFIIPVHHAFMGAIGAALLSEGSGMRFSGTEKLEEYLEKPREAAKGMEPLSPPAREEGRYSIATPSPAKVSPGEKREAFLGIDVGSLSTNVVALDSEGRMMSWRYLPTGGRPIEAVKRGIREVGEEVAAVTIIRGVCTTGSGRYLTGDFVGADMVKNEITAQATAAIRTDPSVDTIFEIGGQDSKYISIDKGAIVDFEMNKVCAAGTGSFLEEQAERLGINIKEEFASLSFSSASPVQLGERCTVFMETDIVHHQQMMSETKDLCAGLSYSIASNYLNRVVGRKKIGERIFFQGGVALNRSVVAAFEKILGKKITVPPYNEVTGAIGAALLARAESGRWPASRFRGWNEVSEASYELSSFECSGCPNHCEIREVRTRGNKPLYYGSRCEKYNVDSPGVKKDSLPDLFGERDKFLLRGHGEKGEGRPGIGIPRALIFYDIHPFWEAFFDSLGFETILSDRTSKNIVRAGLDSVVEETCFPVKVAHGHISNLLGKKVDYIFLPMIVNTGQKSPNMEQSFNCPYVQTLPFVSKSAFDFESSGTKLLNPVIAFGWGKGYASERLITLGKELGSSKRLTLKAIEAGYRALAEFRERMKSRGREILASLPPDRVPVVIVSRSYNGCDPGINLNLPEILRSVGAYPIPLDFLPLEEVDISEEWPSMYWSCGQKIMAAADLIRKHDRLQCLYITNFGCGPDSFILHFFREKMKGKPFLEMEVDEHSADVGAVTRCEAFMDSIRNAHDTFSPPGKARKAYAGFSTSGNKRRFYIPYMGDTSRALSSALRAEGMEAEIFPESNDETLEIGRKFTCGKECYPCIITTGDMVRIVKSPGFKPAESIFFMPSTMGPCRFGQYNRLQRIILDSLGYDDVPIVSPNQVNSLHKELKVCGKSVFRNTWRGVVAIDLLGDMSRRIRPYEVDRGETDMVYEKSLHMVLGSIESGKNPSEALKKAARLFKSVRTNGLGDKPAVGIVGEIFIRSNEFSNNHIVRKMEDLGAEVWLASISEWFLHVNRTVSMHALIQRRYISLLVSLLTGYIQKRDEKILRMAAGRNQATNDEPSISRIWEYSSPYLPGWFGEAALSMGRSRDYVEKGVSGIINVMPFTCLPGTIAGAVFKRFQEENGNIPFLSMAYDGLEQANAELRLESFMHQAAQYKKYKHG